MTIQCHSDRERNERRGISKGESQKEISKKTITFKLKMKTLGTHNYYVYILTNKIKTVLYIGVTNNLKERLYFHRNPEAISKAFTTRYKVYYLVYFEHFMNVKTAIAREKQLKGWRREKKEKLINSFNPSWKFLNDEI